MKRGKRSLEEQIPTCTHNEKDFKMEEAEKLKELSGFFKRMNSKVMLIKLLKKAKVEYDRYNFELGRLEFEKAYQLDSNNPAVLRGLGCLELFEKRYDNAIDFSNLVYGTSIDKHNPRKIGLVTAFFYINKFPLIVIGPDCKKNYI